MHTSQTTRGAAPAAVTGNAFQRDGEYWTVAYEGVVCRLRDTKGLQYLALLLRQPGQRRPARDLYATVAASRRPDDATVARSQKAEDEHARLIVTKHLKASIRRIQMLHPALGYHLGTTIKTGYACAYWPDPTRPTQWTVRGEGQTS